TSSYIIYFKFLNPSFNSPDNWFLGISPEGIGFLGMIINFAVAFSVSSFTNRPPSEVNEMIDNIRRP
ncbi:cation acetate symporter, partial [SAR86 cluster bacterium]|nr:cation acetate symporter [SAR86 cluster bacterium]